MTLPLIAFLPLPLGGVLADAFSGAIPFLVGSSGLTGGAAHYAAVLAGRSEREIDRATAFGFFFGFGLGAFALAIDSIT